jgi:hypothetical protein
MRQVFLASFECTCFTTHDCSPSRMEAAVNVMSPLGSHHSPDEPCQACLCLCKWPACQPIPWSRYLQPVRKKPQVGPGGAGWLPSSGWLPGSSGNPNPHWPPGQTIKTPRPEILWGLEKKVQPAFLIECQLNTSSSLDKRDSSTPQAPPSLDSWNLTELEAWNASTFNTQPGQPNPTSFALTRWCEL